MLLKTAAMEGLEGAFALFQEFGIQCWNDLLLVIDKFSSKYDKRFKDNAEM